MNHLWDTVEPFDGTSNKRVDHCRNRDAINDCLFGRHPVWFKILPLSNACGHKYHQHQQTSPGLGVYLGLFLDPSGEKGETIITLIMFVNAPIQFQFLPHCQFLNNTRRVYEMKVSYFKNR